MTTALAIQRATAAEFGVTVADLRGPSQCRAISRPRHVAMWLCRDLRGLSFARIGTAFGRDKTTVHQACVRFAESVAADPDLASVRDRIIQRLAGQ